MIHGVFPLSMMVKPPWMPFSEPFAVGELEAAAVF
jgi:hypothetical protein